jgi:hypothetical protein
MTGRPSPFAAELKDAEYNPNEANSKGARASSKIDSQLGFLHCGGAFLDMLIVTSFSD